MIVLAFLLNQQVCAETMKRLSGLERIESENQTHPLGSRLSGSIYSAFEERSSPSMSKVDPFGTV